MTASVARLGGAIAIVTLAILVPQPAEAQPEAPKAEQVAEANRHFKQGVQLFRESATEAALAEFKRAYLIAPDWHVLYNIGQCQLELKNSSAAYLAFDQYLRKAVGISAHRRAEIEANVKQLESRIARVRVQSNVEGAEVKVDDEVIGKAPTPAPTLLNLGPHRITVTAENGLTSTKLVDLASGDDVTVDVQLVEAPPARVPAPELHETIFTPPPRVERGPSRTWIGWTAASALAAGAVTTGLLALKAKGDANEASATFGVSQHALDSANSRKQALGIATDVLAGAAIVTAGVTLYIALRSGKSGAARSAKSPFIVQF